MLLSSDNCLSSLLLFAHLALGCSLFFGEANLFPRLTCGSFFTSSSGKCLEQTREYDLRSLSDSWKAFSQTVLLSESVGKRWKEALESLDRVFPHTRQESPGIVTISWLCFTLERSFALLLAPRGLYFSIEYALLAYTARCRSRRRFKPSGYAIPILCGLQ